MIKKTTILLISNLIFILSLYFFLGFNLIFKSLTGGLLIFLTSCLTKVVFVRLLLQKSPQPTRSSLLLVVTLFSNAGLLGVLIWYAISVLKLDAVYLVSGMVGGLGIFTLIFYALTFQQSDR